MTKERRYTLFHIFRRLVPMVFKGIPLFLLVETVLSIANSVSGAILPYLTQSFLDSVQAQVGSPKPDLTHVIITLATLGIVMVVGRLFNGTFHVIGRTLVICMNGIFMKLVHDKAARIDPTQFEMPEMMDTINKAKEGTKNATDLVFIQVLILTYNIPFYIVTSVYLYTLKPVLAVAMFVSFLPATTTLLVRSSVFGKLEDRVAPLRRKFEYFERTLSDREYFKETRILGAVPFFSSLYRSALRLYSREQGQAERKSAWIELGLHTLTLLSFFGVMMLAVRALLAGDISAGAFAAVFTAVASLIGSTRYLVCTHFGNMSKNIGTVRNFLRFLDMPERSGKKVPEPGAGGVVLSDAAFRYPGADRNALSHINLAVVPGETIAVVGQNGAGKTTLVRLMTGLYLPTEGSVRLRDIETRDIDPSVLYGNTTAVFQKFQKYKLKLDENVTISDADAPHQADEVVGALQKADLSPEDVSFPSGMETMLSREFDGVDLSGGQWQRMAIARGLYRHHDFIVLDEPTASIDPLEERRIYRQFAELSQGKTAVIVTHRLGSTRLADRIVVMNGGSIEAVGGHDELLRISPTYAQMWMAQAQWYIA